METETKSPSEVLVTKDEHLPEMLPTGVVVSPWQEAAGMIKDGDDYVQHWHFFGKNPSGDELWTESWTVVKKGEGRRRLLRRCRDFAEAIIFALLLKYERRS